MEVTKKGEIYMKGNFRSLSKEDLAIYISKYSFERQGDTILVYSIGLDGSTRVVGHPWGKNFTTNIRDKNGEFKQHLAITPKAQEMWDKEFPKENLGAVQNALNQLYLENKPATAENVKAILK